MATVLCGQCNTTVAVPSGHSGVITCGACKATLQIGAPQAPPSYQANPSQCQQAHVTVVQTGGCGGCPNCGGPMGPPQWTATAWLLCICFFPWNFCIPGCQPSEQRCVQCGFTRFVEM